MRSASDKISIFISALVLVGCVRQEDTNYVVVPTISQKIITLEYATNWKYTVAHRGMSKYYLNPVMDEEHVEYAQSSETFHMDVEKGVNMPLYSPWICWQNAITRTVLDREHFVSGFTCNYSDLTKVVKISIEARCNVNEESSSIKDVVLKSDVDTIDTKLSVQCETVRVK